MTKKLLRDSVCCNVSLLYIISVIQYIAISSEFKFKNGSWNYEKQDYGENFVPKDKQVDEVKMYDETTMPKFENKKDLMD